MPKLWPIRVCRISAIKVKYQASSDGLSESCPGPLPRSCGRHDHPSSPAPTFLLCSRPSFSFPPGRKSIPDGVDHHLFKKDPGSKPQGLFSDEAVLSTSIRRLDRGRERHRDCAGRRTEYTRRARPRGIDPGGESHHCPGGRAWPECAS